MKKTKKVKRRTKRGKRMNAAAKLRAERQETRKLVNEGPPSSEELLRVLDEQARKEGLLEG